MNGDNPYQPAANWADGNFRDSPQVAVSAQLPRGLIGHVRIVAILLILQGLLELMFGMLGLAFLLLVKLGPQKEFAALHGVGYMMAGAGAVALIAGLLRLVAGYFNLNFRCRGLGLAAMGVGLLTLLTGYCAPTAIAIAIYGLIVYVDESVVAAFQRGARGESSAEIKRAFAPRP